jgi:tRNA(Ile)-lysidine synthase
LYYVFVHELAQKLCHYIRDTELLHPGDRVGVAVSGGPDSVALLRLLLEMRKELGIVLSVVHVNHKLRGAQSDADADFVSALARTHKIQLYSTAADVAQHASDFGISIETAARELRYKFFRQVLGDEITHGSTRISTDQKTEQSDPRKSVQIRGRLLNKIATGHTLDDQAETVLMRIIRGTGMRGLRAIQPIIHAQTEHGSGEIVRPLLAVRRAQLQAYLDEIGQPWREDATNRDPKFTRNRVRQLLMPLLEREFNPAIRERLAELAEIARAEEDFWDNEAEGWLGTGIQLLQPQNDAAQLVQLAPVRGSGQASKPASAPANVLVDLAWLLSEEGAVQRRIVKVAAEQAGLALDFQHVEDILRLAAEEGSAGKEIVLAGGWKARCDEDALEFVAPGHALPSPTSTDYQMRLSVPGQVTIAQAGCRLEAIRLETNKHPAGADPEHAFDAALLATSLTVRNWHPGDRFWPAHTRSAKKVKELLQEAHVRQPERAHWPVVLNGDEIIWVRGFPGRAHMRPAAGQPAVLIREQPLERHP